MITQSAEKHKLDPDLVAAVILWESGGKEKAISGQGAVGLMQVMPREATGFMCPNGPCFAKRPTRKKLLDPAFNIEYGTKLLASKIKQQGSIRDGLKSYGQSNVGYRFADGVLKLVKKHGS